jgi:3-oxoacyl-[acyl-carrier-protein] synthase-3
MHKMTMVGGEVFKFATRVVDESIRQACDIAGIRVDQIEKVIPHQANQRILKAAARKLGMAEDKFISNVERYGNTSAASIPIALCEAIDEGMIHQDDYIAFVGFGGGLSWASMIVKWGVPEPNEYHSSRINRQRRRAFYTFAKWRARWIRLRRNLSQNIDRLHPIRGRFIRLRRQVDRYEEEL